MIKDNLREIYDTLSSLDGYGEHVKLIAVSKFKPVNDILCAYKAGQLVFGENRIQEALQKIPQLPSDISWHFIGSLQSNKAKYCPTHFKVIHSLDNLRVAQLLQKKCLEKDTSLQVLVQMNLCDENTKNGFINYDELKEFTENIFSLDRLKLVGLMTIPHVELNEIHTAKIYSSLFQMKEKLSLEFSLQSQLTELSMGMSNDYKIAVQEGATYIRIGTAIFGKR